MLNPCMQKHELYNLAMPGVLVLVILLLLVSRIGILIIVVF